MASVQVYNSRGNKYVRIVESFRDPETKKPRTKTLENLGRLDQLEAVEPNIIQRLKEKYAAQRQQADQQKTNDSLQYIQSILEATEDMDGLPLKNYGYLMYRKVWDDLKLNYFFDYRQKKESKITFPVKNIAALMTYMRLMQPGSKKRTLAHGDQLFNMDTDAIDLNHVYRSLAFFADQKTHLEQYLNRQISQQMDRELSVCFYDVTTYYFESQSADDLKRFGFSKDNKVNQVQVVMGLLIDAYGIPISYELFPGNTSEFSTLAPVLLRLKEEYGIQKIIITADRGLNSKANLARIRQMGFDYVMAYKIRTAAKDVKEMVLDQSGYQRYSKDMSMRVTQLSQHVRLDGVRHDFEDQFVLTHSVKRAKKDKQDRARLIEKAVKLSESKSRLKTELKKGGKKYVQLEFNDLELDVNQKKIEEDSRFDGYYGIVCSDPALSAPEIIEKYQGLWKIEESFRVMKSNLEARPLFVWTPDSIKGHFVLCYLSLVIQRLLEYTLKTQGVEISTERIQNACQSGTISIVPQEKGTDYYIKNTPNTDFNTMIQALDLNVIPTVGKTTQIKL